MIAECVMERRGLYGLGRDVWHVVLGNGDADFQPILCGLQDGSGINLPGHSEFREPTCPSCLLAASPRKLASTNREET